MARRRSAPISARASGSRHCAVILGAGQGRNSSLPSALTAVPRHGRVLDWQLNAFERLGDVRILFVGGYKMDEVVKAYPTIQTVLNPRWKETGPAGSLACADLRAQVSVMVSYADVVFRPRLVERLAASKADVCLAVDTHWRERYEARSQDDIEIAEKVVFSGNAVGDVGKSIDSSVADAEFAGVVKFSPDAAVAVTEFLHGRGSDLGRDVPDVLRHLLREGFSSGYIDVMGDWAELNAPQDLARFVLGTKAETLERLRPLLRIGKIGKMVCFAEREWFADSTRIVKDIVAQFRGDTLIVRSSAISEDTWAESGAGTHLSIQGVPARHARIRRAVDSVLKSYRRKSARNQVLVQSMLSGVVISGVVMTRTVAVHGPYYVFNFDDLTSFTDSVTSGTGRHLRTVYVRKDCPERHIPRALRGVAAAVREIEALVGYDSLDIEFAQTADGKIHVLQVRPMVRETHHARVLDDEIYSALIVAKRQFRSLRQPGGLIMGERARYSVMTDWNPAEMIGVKPRRLALSLYRMLITDEVWAQARAEYGYCDIRPCPLLVEFVGHPYIDVRASFNSFIPADIPRNLSEKLVNFYLAKLELHPELHDKVEFEIAVTSLQFNFEGRARELLKEGFSASEMGTLRRSLAKLTTRGLNNTAVARSRIETLDARRSRLLKIKDPLPRAVALLDDARRFGTPAFASLARSGFIAVGFLDSMVSCGILSESHKAAFLESVHTPANEMQRDAYLVKSGKRDWAHFVGAYGHLRPGTYDILSPTYREEAKLILRPMIAASFGARRKKQRQWNVSTRHRIEVALENLGVRFDASNFELMLRKAIEGREWSKFSFSKNLSLALDALAEFGEGQGSSRDDISHLDIREIQAARSMSAIGACESLRAAIASRRRDFERMQATSLPSQIGSEIDFLRFEQPPCEPNFVTRKAVQAEIRLAAGGSARATDWLKGKIAVLPSADPGYDWIFTRGIVGLVTMYGGVNSHMAIRAASFGLPAAIGVGESLYERISHARLLEINCAARQIRIVEK
ncbi:MAG: hypothetical protein HY313_10340 [Acidobacteria bacterium]|nr:hypothetical protein [Acidobacteriota bacterium]